MSENNEINVYELMAPHFWDVYDDLQAGSHLEYWLKGGRASTKSSFIAIAIVVGMLQDYEANAIVYRQVGNTIRDSVFAQIIWAINVLGVNSICKYRTAPYEVIFVPTGQRILFRGADDPMKSKSIKLTKGHFKYLWFEELAEFHGMEAIRTIKQSIIRGTDIAFTLYSYNPPRSAQNWVNSESLLQIPSRLVHTSTYLDVPREWIGDAFIHEAEVLKKTNEMAYRNEYLGEVTGNGGSVFENVVVRDITDAEVATFQWFYQGVDWGYFPDPFQWVRCAFDSRKRILYIIDEYRSNKQGNYDAFQSIKSKLRPEESLVADSAEPKSISDFREYGAYWIHAVLKGPGSVDYSIKWLAALGKIVISTKCVHTAKEFLSYEYARNKDGEFVNGYVDSNNHSIDAVRYALFPVWRRKGE